MRVSPRAGTVVVLAALACRPAGPSRAADRPQNGLPAPLAGSPSPDDAGVEAEGSTLRPDFDLLANRVQALVHRDGRLLVSTADPSFLKFVDGGWKTSWILGEREGGKRAALVNGLSSALFVPIDTDGDGPGGQGLADVRLRLTLRSRAPKQRVSVFVNEKAVGTYDVPVTSTTHDLTVPGALLIKGENRIRLTFRTAAPLSGKRRSAAVVEQLELGPATATDVAPQPLPPVADVDLGAERRHAFSLTGPSRLSFYVQVPPGGQLAVAYGSTQPGTKVIVRMARDGAPTVTLFEGPAPSSWTEGSWDVSAAADQVVRIDLVSRGGGVAWAAPRLLAKAPPPVAAGKRSKIERVYIWMVDTLRADKVHVYNPKTVVQTPNYDAFANDATRFAWAEVPGTWSLPSHASILTGVYPSVHQAIAHEARLSREVPFIAELLKKAGYRTAMFSSNGYVSAKWGFDRGWDANRNFIRESLPSSADYLWKFAKPWILANKAKPEFAYLATVEPHVIYNPKKQFLARYWKKPYKGPIKPTQTGIQLGKIKSGKLKVNDTDKAYLEALHNGEITESDSYFATFIADLKSAGLYDTSAIIVISDHGDEFWDHGDVGHAQSVHQELVHIPLIIRAPGVFPAGRVVRADVEAMDVFATILDMTGLPIPPETQGSSLVPLVRDELGPRAAWSQNLGISRGLKVGRYRFIHSGAKLELYDELADPLEKSDESVRRPIALRAMRNVFSLLAAYESRWKKRQWGTAANVTEAFYSAVDS
jgi:choline-sulfatase